ncbi:MAG: phenylalanine--tRNA ligase subunit beta, partial [Ilumatobacteraceae bacterium]
MKILLSWLNSFADFADPTDAEAVAAIAADLTSLGLAVEEVIPLGQGVDGVVSARVLRVETHPDAAKVRRVWVDAGDGVERHVWCGASNMEAGDLVPLATLGTAMPDGRLIERRGILGIDSEGMLCSGAELGVDDDGSGILLLDSDAAPGRPYTEVLGLDADVLFDLDVTRNRPDCWSHLGVARDLAARRGVALRNAPIEARRRGIERSVPVEILAEDRCGSFTTTVLSGVTVTQSP